ncbi:MAG: CheB methylesterase domain-containing protein, partial [bacterium]|nr:CheB methylesterase domain-containing protein [bacterium]
GAVTLSSEPSVHRVKPCIDAMMEAAAQVYGAKTIGVLLSGMGRDGVKGLKAIKEAGGKTIAQDESSSIVFGMAKAAIEEGVVDKVVPANKIIEEVLKLI